MMIAMNPTGCLAARCFTAVALGTKSGKKSQALAEGNLKKANMAKAGAYQSLLLGILSS